PTDTARRRALHSGARPPARWRSSRSPEDPADDDVAHRLRCGRELLQLLPLAVAQHAQLPPSERDVEEWDVALARERARVLGLLVAVDDDAVRPEPAQQSSGVPTRREAPHR